MVKEWQQRNRVLYSCEVCGVSYEQREWEEKCQEWCETHNGSCNIEIIQHSVSLEEAGE